MKTVMNRLRAVVQKQRAVAEQDRLLINRRAHNTSRSLAKVRMFMSQLLNAGKNTHKNVQDKFLIRK